MGNNDIACPGHDEIIGINVWKLTLIICLSTLFQSVQAFTVEVTDQNGTRLSNSVIAISGAQQQDTATQTHILDQINKRFTPEVIAIQKGDLVRFPNKDNIRHHVYSFSKPKPFELPLYSGEPAEPVLFNNTGKVILGCNIHDRMRGYIYIVDTPHYKVAENGTADFDITETTGLTVEIYHPESKVDPAISRAINSNELSQGKITIALDIETIPLQTNNENLTELEKKFLELRRGKN